MSHRPIDERFAHFCRTGDPGALGEVFDATARELLKVALWVSGNRADAEDLLQRTFLLAIETRQKFERGRPAVPWLLGLLAREARRLRRERARRASGATQLSSGPDPEAEAAAAELTAAVREVRAELPVPYRDVLHLHLEQGLNAKEIAAALGRPAGTVRTQLMRALQLLRNALPGGFATGVVPVLPDFTTLAGVKANVLAAAGSTGVATATTATTAITAGTAATAATATIVTGGVLMSKILFTASAAVLLFAVGGYAVWRAAAPDAQIPLLAELPRSAGATPASQPSPGAEAPDRSGEPLARVAAAAGAPATGLPPVPAEASWIEVRVVDKATGAAIGGADVAWMDHTTYERVPASTEDRQWMNDKEAIARTWGWRARGDEHGVVRVHVADWTTVCARDGTRYGSLQYVKKNPAPPEGYRIELEVDRTLLVQVVDAGGRPASGVALAIALHGADGAFLRLSSLAGRVRSEQPDGQARFVHLQEWRERSWFGEVLVPAAEWRVRVAVPGLEDPGVVFDPDAPPAETVVLRLPPTGGIAVRVEVRGQRVPGHPTIGIHTGGVDDVAARNDAWNRPVGTDGHGRFPRVPLGCTFVASARVNVATLQREFAGPTAPGEEVTVVLNPSDDDVVLTGRILDDRQQLVRDAELSVHFRFVRGDSFSGGDTSLRTDVHGRFVFFPSPGGGKDNRLESFVVELPVKDGAPLRAELAPRELRPGQHDVGDLLLRPAPLVVAGRFLTGKVPYEKHVQLWVERRHVSRSGPPSEHWEEVKGLHTARGPAGTFEVRGEAVPGPYRLTFPGWGHLPVAPVEFVPGTVNLEVQVVRGEELAATVLLPSGLPWGFQAVLKAEAPAERSENDESFVHYIKNRHLAESQEQGSGRYSLLWQAVAPGSYALELRLWGVAQPLLSIPKVRVPDATADGRLRDIDLRDQVAVLTVRIVDTEGKLMKDTPRTVFVFQPPLDPAADWFAHPVVSGALRIPVRAGPTDLLVASEGFQPREVRAARGEVDVVLGAWPETELVFPDLPELPQGYGLWVTLRPAESGKQGGYRIRNAYSGSREGILCPPVSSKQVENGRARLPIGDGVQQLSVTLSDASGRARFVRGVTPGEVSRGGGGPIGIRVPAEAVRAAIAEQQKSGNGR